MKNEIWKNINNYYGDYQISNLGRVKSCKYSKETILKYSSSNSYDKVRLSYNGISKDYTIHRLVCEHFLDNPENKQQVNHIDGNKKNNKLDNLEWATRSENMLHAHKTGLKNAQGENNSQSKLTEKEVIIIKKLLKENKLKQIEIANLFDISFQTINCIKNDRKWKHVRI